MNTFDEVVVAVNHTEHYDVARACLETGLHVMIEKPMVLDPAHVAELLDLAERNGVEIIVGYPWHYTEIARRAREVIEEGAAQSGRCEACMHQWWSSSTEAIRGPTDRSLTTRHGPAPGATRTYNFQEVGRAVQVTHSAGLLLGHGTDIRVSAFMENYDVPVDVVDAINVRLDSGAIGVVGHAGNIGTGRYGAPRFTDSALRTATSCWI